ncbi:hypothetical protein C2G38_461656 [Gigaspora rosea]|uniref:Uncharacterized protein n=1 Tax=Gigaspora rosea TaxID=44941 RepID=A0A397UIZ4_9GLOM|nr:hypothetical protein C2G38_461656 [Gigaspora rosea]
MVTNYSLIFISFLGIVFYLRVDFHQGFALHLFDLRLLGFSGVSPFAGFRFRYTKRNTEKEVRVIVGKKQTFALVSSSNF